MLILRKLVKSDLQQVVCLENENPSPWSSELLARELAFEGGLQFVVEETKDNARGIVAWCACRVIEPEAELLKIAVGGSCRRSGLGRLLLGHLVVNLRKKKVDRLFLEVRSQNQEALLFYENYGFAQLGIRPNYYKDPSDDALFLRKAI